MLFQSAPYGISVSFEGNGVFARHLFVANHITDLISYVRSRPYRFPAKIDFVFASLGNIPNQDQMEYLRKRFPKAKLELLFGGDMVDRITSCSVALWFNQKRCTFSYRNGHIQFRFKGMVFSIAEGDFSLNRFERFTKLRLGARVHRLPII